MPKGQVLENYLREKYGDDWTAESVHQANQGQPKVQSAAQPQPQQEEYVLPEPQQAIVDTFRQPEAIVEERARAEQPKRVRTSFDDVVDQAQAVYRERAKEKGGTGNPSAAAEGTKKPSAAETEAPKEAEKEAPQEKSDAAKYTLAQQTWDILNKASPRRQDTGRTLPEMERKQQLQDLAKQAAAALYEKPKASRSELERTARGARQIAQDAEKRMQEANYQASRAPSYEASQAAAAARANYQKAMEDAAKAEADLRPYQRADEERAVYELAQDVSAAQSDPSFRDKARTGRIKWQQEQDAAMETARAADAKLAQGGAGANPLMLWELMQQNRDDAGYSRDLETTFSPEGLTEDQKDVYFALWVDDPARAAEYAQYITKAKDQEYLSKLSEWAGKNPATRAAALLLGTNLNLASGADPFGRAGQAASTLGQAYIGGGAKGLQEKGLFNTGALSGTIPEDTPVVGWLLKGKGLGDLYQLTSSMVQSGETALMAGMTGGLGAFAGTALMGGSAAASDYREQLENGIDPKTAALHATAAGVAEGLFEYLSIEKLVDQDVTKSFLKNVLRQGGFEASEELTTSLANRITDGLIKHANGYDSDIDARRKELMAQGMSYADASARAEWDWTVDLLNDGLGGFLSGGLMTAGNYALTGPAAAAEVAADTDFSNADMLAQPPNTQPVQNVALEQQAQAAPMQQEAAPVQQTAPAEMQTPAEANVQQEAASEATEATDEDLDFDSLAQSDPGEEGMYNSRAAGMQTEEELAGPDNVPKVSMREFADDVNAIYPVRGSAKTEARQIINDLASEVVRSGTVSEEALDAAARKLEDLAIYEKEETENDRIFREFRQAQRGQKIYVDAETRAALGDDWNRIRNEARKAGVTLTTKQFVQDKLQNGQKVTREAEGVTDFASRMMDPENGYSSLFAGMNEMDSAAFLDRLAKVLGEGKAQQVGYTEHILGYKQEMDAVHEGYRQQLRDAARTLLQNSAREQAWADQYGGKGNNSSRTMANDTGLKNDPFTVYQAVEQGGMSNPSATERNSDLPEGVARRQVVDNTLRNSPLLEGAYNQIEAELNSTDPDAATYDIIHEKESLAEATERVETDSAGELEKLLNKDREWTGSDMDTAMLLMGQAQQDGATEIAVELAAEAARRGTVAGQMIQALAKWSRTANGAAVQAVGELENDNSISKKKKAKLEQTILESGKNIQDAIDEMEKIKDDFEMQPGVSENADGQLEQSLLPAKEKIIGEIKKLARTRNTVSLFTKQISRMTEWALNQCTADECADIATAQLRAAASDLTHRTTLAEKMATIQCLSQLSSIGTVFRNLAGNAAFNVYDATSSNFGAAWDWLMSKATGKRTMTFDPGAVNKATWEGRKHGFAKAYAEVVLDADTDNVETRYGQTKGRTFKMTGNLFERFMSTWEKASGIALNASDEYFKGGTEESYLARTQKLVDKGLLTAEEQQRLAEKEKLERTFQQDSKLAKFSINMKNAANVFGFGGSNFVKDENGKTVKDKNGKAVWMNRGRLNDASYIQELADRSGLTPTAIKNQMSEARFGLGNFLVNYPKIPGNLGSLLLESAPITSTINTLAKTFKVLQAGQYADAETQYEAAKAFGRSVTGYGVTAAAYLLAKAGVLMVSGVNPDEDKDRKAQQAANGLSGMQINIDGLERLRKGEDPRLRNGDTLLSVDFLEPVSGLFTIGGMMAENDVDFENLAKTTLEGSVNSIMDIPVMESMKNLFKDYDNYGILGSAERFVGSGASGFIPAPVRNLAKATDPYYRETGNAETIPGQILDSVKNNIPGLRQTLPVKTDALGQEKTYKASDTMRWLNALVNPGNLSVYETNDVTEELEKQFQETGEGSFAKSGRNSIPTKIKVNGEDVDLTKEQQLDFKNTRGQTYAALIREMKNDPAYKNATPEERNKMLDEAWTASSEVAKVAAGVGYETDNKLVGMMQDGLSLPEAYAVKQWSKDRKADQKDAGKMFAYKMGLTDTENWTGGKTGGLKGNEITEELERVYSSAGDGKLPTGEIPDHLTVDGEEVELTEQQREQFKSERATVYNGILEDLLASDRYKNADAEKQLAMLEAAYETAGEAAKVNLELGYQSDKKIYKLVQSGLGVADAYAAKEMHNEIDEKKKSDGKSLNQNTKAAQFKSWAQSQGWTKAQTDAVLDKYGTYSSMTFSDTEKYDKLTASGLSGSKASKLITDLNKLMPQNGKEDVTDLQRMKLIANDKSLNADQKILAAYLYAGNSKTSLDKFLDSGLGIAEYVDAKEAIQKYGHQTSSGTWSWKKDELIKYLNSTDYTNQQKFWVMKTFWTGKDKNNPWYRYAGDPAEHREPDGTGGGNETEDGETGSGEQRQMTADEAWKILNGG